MCHAQALGEFVVRGIELNRLPERAREPIRFTGDSAYGQVLAQRRKRRGHDWLAGCEVLEELHRKAVRANARRQKWDDAHIKRFDIAGQLFIGSRPYKMHIRQLAEIHQRCVVFPNPYLADQHESHALALLCHAPQQRKIYLV